MSLRSRPFIRSIVLFSLSIPFAHALGCTEPETFESIAAEEPEKEPADDPPPVLDHDTCQLDGFTSGVRECRNAVTKSGVDLNTFKTICAGQSGSALCEFDCHCEVTYDGTHACATTDVPCPHGVVGGDWRQSINISVPPGSCVDSVNNAWFGFLEVDGSCANFLPAMRKACNDACWASPKAKVTCLDCTPDGDPPTP